MNLIERGKMRRCTRCILPETYPGISFNAQGVCNYCENYKVFIPKGEEVLINYFRKAKRKKRKYDVLVPLSGGKDSTYTLYLAKKIYNLNVLTCTFDNGFFNNNALNNIKSAVKKLNVDHIFYRPNWDIMKRLYKATLLNSGELCSACGIGIKSSYLKISSDWHIPLILIGTSVIEEGSYTTERIYNVNRFKAILADADDITTEEVNHFLIHLPQNLFSKIIYSKLGIYTKLGKFTKIVEPLYYVSKKSEEEITKILSRETNWQCVGNAKYGKHFDCLAEPFSNFLREHRYGYSRRVCQFSNLIRVGEITREKAIEMLNKENPLKEPDETDLILKKLEISREELDEILKNSKFRYHIES